MPLLLKQGGENGEKYQSIEGLNSNCLGWTYATNKTVTKVIAMIVVNPITLKAFLFNKPTSNLPATMEY